MQKTKFLLIFSLILFVSKTYSDTSSQEPKIISLHFPEPLTEALLRCHKSVCLNETLWIEFPAAFHLNHEGYPLEEFICLAHQNGFEIEQMKADRILIAPSKLEKQMHVLLKKVTP